jgi:SAM-dependent methyltransferase
MSKKLKKNVGEFNNDVVNNQGYKYTSNAPYSSIVANERMTRATLENLDGGVKSLIDIGCGDGTYTAEIKKAFPKMRIEGTDPADKAVKLAGKKYGNIRFFVSNILDRKTFTSKASKYDAAVLRGVLHHLSDPELAIKNSISLSEKLIIMEPNGNNFIIKLIEKISKYHVEHEERSFTTGALVKFCEAAGAKVDKIYNIGYVPFFFPEALSRMIYFLQPFLEKVPVVNFFFTAQIIVVCSRQGKQS